MAICLSGLSCQIQIEKDSYPQWWGKDKEGQGRVGLFFQVHIPHFNPTHPVSYLTTQLPKCLSPGGNDQPSQRQNQGKGQHPGESISNLDSELHCLTKVSFIHAYIPLTEQDLISGCMNEIKLQVQRGNGFTCTELLWLFINCWQCILKYQVSQDPLCSTHTTPVAALFLFNNQD